MEPKKVLASAFFTAALVLAPVSTATAAPAADSSPGVTDVRHNDRGWDNRGDHDRDRHDRDRHDRDRHDRDRGWDNNWRSNCFWFGPWLVCMPW